MSELKEINTLVMPHSHSLNRMVGGKKPDPELLSTETNKLEKRLEGALKVSPLTTIFITIDFW